MATSMANYEAEREAMVERHLKRRGITETPIIDAFLAVPREEFVSPEYAHLAYGDHPLPIEAGQTISQPYIVALMIQAAGIKPGDKVLEVGAGSGYAAAVISRIAGKVFDIERQHDLVEVGQRARTGRQRAGRSTVDLEAIVLQEWHQSVGLVGLILEYQHAPRVLGDRDGSQTAAAAAGVRVTHADLGAQLVEAWRGETPLEGCVVVALLELHRAVGHRRPVQEDAQLPAHSVRCLQVDADLDRLAHADGARHVHSAHNGRRRARRWRRRHV